MLHSDPMQSAERYAWLQSELARLDHAYYVLDTPLLPDSEYDRLYRELIALEQVHPDWVTPDSLSQRVGGAALKEFTSVPTRINHAQGIREKDKVRFFPIFRMIHFISGIQNRASLVIFL